jgi:hypothetical protein
MHAKSARYRVSFQAVSNTNTSGAGSAGGRVKPRYRGSGIGQWISITVLPHRHDPTAGKKTVRGPSVQPARRVLTGAPASIKNNNLL